MAESSEDSSFEFEILPFDDPIFSEVDESEYFGPIPKYPDLRTIVQRIQERHKNSENKIKRIKKRALPFLKNLIPSEIKTEKLTKKEKVEKKNKQRYKKNPLEMFKDRAQNIVFKKRFQTLTKDPFSFLKKNADEEKKKFETLKPAEMENLEEVSGMVSL